MTFMQFAEKAYSGVQKAFLGGRAIHPLALNLILTYACNLECHSCLYHSDDAHPEVQKLIARRAKQQLTWEDIERILIDAKKSGVRFVTLHGGEPTIHLLFDRLMDKITELGMKSSFVSNGYSTQSKAEVILRNNIRNINISIDGIEELQDYIRGKKGLYQNSSRFRRFRETGHQVFSGRLYQRPQLQASFGNRYPPDRVKAFREDRDGFHYFSHG
jgi:sulfatase maturation enzyme AslB (radical SAM superfamily)